MSFGGPTYHVYLRDAAAAMAPPPVMAVVVLVEVVVLLVAVPVLPHNTSGW